MSKSLLRAALVFLCAGPVTASDWPCYRGPHADAVVTDPNLLTEWPPEGLKELWSFPLLDDKDNTHAGPSIAGGKVYVCSRVGEKDVVFCLDEADGHQLWKFDYEAPVHDEVYGTGIRACPTIYKQFVYTLSCFGELICLNKDNGALVWRRSLMHDFNGKPPSFGMSAAPTILLGMLVCFPGGPGASIVALEPETGKEIWKSGNDEASYAAPVLATVAGTQQILAYMSPGLVSVDPKTGKELWRYNYVDERRKNIPSPIAVGDVVYLSNNTLGFTAIKLTPKDDGPWQVNRVWTARTEKMHYSSPVLGDGCLYFHNSKREIKCIALADGSVRWTAPNLGTQYGAVIRLNEDRLLTALDNGEIALLAISPKDFKEISRFKPLEKAFLQPSIADGKLFIRDHTRVVCFQLSKESAVVAQLTNPAPPPAATTIAPRHHKSRDDEELPTTAMGQLRRFWSIHFRVFLVGWMGAAALALLGAMAAAKKQLAPVIATVSTSTFGAIAAMWLMGTLAPDSHPFVHSSKFTYVMDIGFAVIPILITMLAGARHSTRISQVLVIASVLGVALLSRTEMATVAPYVVLASSDIGDTRSEVGDFTTVLLATVTIAAIVYWKVLRNRRTAEDFQLAGIKEFLFTLGVGWAIGLGIRSTGTLFTAASLLVPFLAVRAIAQTWRGAFIGAAAVALGSVTLGFGLSYKYQFPPALAAVVCMGFAALFVIAASKLRTPQPQQSPASVAGE